MPSRYIILNKLYRRLFKNTWWLFTCKIPDDSAVAGYTLNATSIATKIASFTTTGRTSAFHNKNGIV